MNDRKEALKRLGANPKSLMVAELFSWENSDNDYADAEYTFYGNAVLRVPIANYPVGSAFSYIVIEWDEGVISFHRKGTASGEREDYESAEDFEFIIGDGCITVHSPVQRPSWEEACASDEKYQSDTRTWMPFHGDDEYHDGIVPVTDGEL